MTAAMTAAITAALPAVLQPAAVPSDGLLCHAFLDCLSTTDARCQRLSAGSLGRANTGHRSSTLAEEVEHQPGSQQRPVGATHSHGP